MSLFHPNHTLLATILLSIFLTFSILTFPVAADSNSPYLKSFWKKGRGSSKGRTIESQKIARPQNALNRDDLEYVRVNSYSAQEGRDTTSPLECIKCSNHTHCTAVWANLEQWWGKLWGIPPHELLPSEVGLLTTPFETCQNVKEARCVLHFSTVANSKGKLLKGFQRIPEAFTGRKVDAPSMFIIKAGCAAPSASDLAKLDGSGCLSTPLKILDESADYLDETKPGKKFAGTHGTRTCYCNDKTKCNTNHVLCHRCQGIYPCKEQVVPLDDDNLNRPPGAIGNYPSAAVECIVASRQDENVHKNLDLVAAMVPFEHDKNTPWPHPRRCPEKFMFVEWEDDKGDIISKDCRCSSEKCNKIVYDVAKFFYTRNKVTSTCLQCNPEEDCLQELKTGLKRIGTCRRGQWCMSTFGLDERSNKYWVLKALGCGGGISNYEGCTPPKRNPNQDRSQICYCNPEHGHCNQMPTLPGTCTVYKGKNATAVVPCDPNPATGILQECFISTEDTLINAGCRNVTANPGNPPDPECDVPLMKQWSKGPSSGRKRVCQCEDANCNRVLLKFLGLEDWSVTTPEIWQPPTKAVKCQRQLLNKPKITEVTCPYGCRYARHHVKGDNARQFYRERDCATGKEVILPGWTCGKMLEEDHGVITIIGYCVCSTDDCNTSNKETEFDKELNKIPDPVPNGDGDGGNKVAKFKRPTDNGASGRVTLFRMLLFGVGGILAGIF